MKQGWEYKKFEACINKTPKPKQVKTEEYNSGTKYPIVSQEDKLISGYYDDESYVFHIDSPVVIFGDHTRVLKYVDFDFVVGADGVKIISPKQELNAKFLLYYLQWYKIPNLGYSRHYKLLKELNIPLPPKSTQLTIVFELDKMNELIRLKKEQLKDFDNLAQSIFYEMFGDPVENEMGWEVKRISNIAKYHNGVAHEKDVDKDGEFILVNAKFISSEGKIRKKTNIQHFPLFRNDVVMVLSDLPNGKSLAKCFLIDEDKKYSLNQRICCFRGFEGSAIFLKYVINRNPYLLLFDNGKSQTNLRKGDVEKMPIPLPPLPLQHLFAQRIEQIEHQKAEVQKAIADLETLLASRMQYWFE